MDYAQLGKTIARIYDAALTPSQWNAVLGDVAHAVSGKACGIVHTEPGYHEVPEAGIYYSRPITAHDVAEYAARFAHEDRLDAVLTRPHLAVVRASEIMADDPGFASSPYQQYLADRFGVFDRVGARLNPVNSWAAMISVYCDMRGPGMTADQQAVFEALLPHVAKAIEVNRPIRLLEARYNAVLEALDRIWIGVGVVTPDGRLVVRNATLAALCEAGDGIRVVPNGRLRALNPDTCAVLDRAVQHASATSRGNGSSPESIVTVPRRGRRKLVLEICPLRDTDRGLGAGFAGAMIYAIDPEDVSSISTRGLQQLFGLSHAEAAVSELMAKGLSNTEIAERRNVSPETIKSQVASILTKTDTASRIEFLRLALHVNLPVEVPAGGS